MRSTYPVDIQVIGVNHDTAPIEVREQLALSGERLSRTYVVLRERYSSGECVILSTCNRFELYLLRQPGHPQEEERPEALLDLLSGDQTYAVHMQEYTYRYRGHAAVKHLFRVTSGIDSLVPGEVQILGQVQRAWQTAHTEGAVGPILSQLVHRAVALGKRVHSETDVSRRPASVSYAAVVLARQVLGTQLQAEGSLQGRRVLLVGSG